MGHNTAAIRINYVASVLNAEIMGHNPFSVSRGDRPHILQCKWGRPGRVDPWDTITAAISISYVAGVLIAEIMGHNSFSVIVQSVHIYELFLREHCLRTIAVIIICCFLPEGDKHL